MALDIHLITLFPEMFKGPFDHSILKKAQEKSLVNLNFVQLRDFTDDKHRTVDDIPYGGGAGMVMKPEPIFKAVESIPPAGSRLVIYPSPQGQMFTQKLAQKLAGYQQLIFICGRYEGVDQRVVEHLVDLEVSIGDYVLTGAELPAMIMIDTLLRELPGVVGKEASVKNDSFQGDLLDYPSYTRPEEFRGWKVPDVLLSGHHAQIEAWRQQKAHEKTQTRSPLSSHLRLKKDVILSRDD